MQRLMMAAAVLVTTSAFALTQPVPFAPGEQATYEVSFLGVPSGVAQVGRVSGVAVLRGVPRSTP